MSDARIDDLARRVERLEATEAIRTAISDYALGADSQDWELLGSVFAEDAVMDMGGTVLTGRAHIVDTMKGILNPDFVAKHLIVNESIRWTDASTATVRAYVLYTHRGSGVNALGWGTYVITVTRTGDQVRFTRMDFAGDAHLMGTVPEAMARIDALEGN